MKSSIYVPASLETLTSSKALYDSLEGGKELCDIDQAPSEIWIMTYGQVGFWLQAGKPGSQD